MKRQSSFLIVLTLMCASLGSATVRADDAAAVSAKLDAIFEERWNKAGIEPVPLADDATFLRRTSLDLTGVIPEIGEVRRFLEDPDPNKRDNLIRKLLDRPRHATHLANVWREVLLPRTVPESTAGVFENWLQTRFQDNVPYNKLAEEILLAQGALGQTPAVLFYAAIDTNPAQIAARTSEVFLGVQIRCAECHDHPFAEWKQTDFWSYAAFFARLNGPSMQNGQVSLTDVNSGEVQLPNSSTSVAPTFLGGAAAKTNEPRRAQLAQWMTDDSNPFFARAVVNRVWSQLFGRGLVQPVDNQGDHNPPTHPEVIELLAEDFVANGYDLRRLYQVIALTRVYQLESQVMSGDLYPMETYASMPVRSLSAEQIYDCLVIASGRRAVIDSTEAEAAEQRSAFLAKIEAPTQEAVEFQGGIPQALTMLNGPFVIELTDPLEGDFIAALADSPFLSHEQRIDALFMATVARRPSASEWQTVLAWCRQKESEGDVGQALSDVLWALLNSSEFILNR